MALPPHLADLESRLASRVDDALGDYRRAIEKRLRDAVEQLAAASQELPPPTLPGLLEGLELASLDLGPRREAARETLDALLDTTRALDRAATQAEALDSLLDGAARWSDRVALMLVRDHELVAWGERGFTAGGFVGQELVGELRDLLVTRAGCRSFDATEASTITGALDVAAGGPAVVIPLVLRDRVAAVLWADRREAGPESGALQLLATAAGQRLELQALSERSHTPTLYAEGEAPGEALALWSVAAPAAVVAEPAVAEPPAEVEPAEAAPEEVAEPPLENLEEAAETWQPVAEPAAGFELAPEPGIDAAAAPQPEAGEALEAGPEVEPLPKFDYAPEPSAEAELAAEPEVAPAIEAEPPAELVTEDQPPAPGLDPHGTVRMAVPPEFAAPRPVEETTAPLAVEPIEPAAEGSVATHEFPAPAAPPAAPPATVEDPMDRTASRGGRSTQVAPPPDIDGPGLAFVSGSASRTLSDSPVHEEAKRLARLLISEIKLYNEEQVIEGRRNRDLYHRLKEDIDRSRQIFDERVDPTVRTDVDYFQQELVRSLAGGDPRALGI